MINWALIVLVGLAGFIIGIFFYAWLEMICSLRRDVKELLEERRKNEVKDGSRTNVKNNKC